MARKRILSSIALMVLILTSTVSVRAQKEKKASSTYLSKKPTKELELAKQHLDNQPVKAIELLSDFFKNNVKSITPQEEVELYQLLGQAHYNLEQYDLALQNFNKVESFSTPRSKLNKGRPVRIPERLYYEIGKVYLAQEDWNAAVKAINRFLTRYKQENSLKGEGLLALGHAHLGNGNLTEAMSSADQVVALGQKLGEGSLEDSGNLLKGRVLEERDEEGSLELYQQLLDDAVETRNINTNRNATEGISRVLDRQDDFQRKLDFRKEALQNSLIVQDTALQGDLNLEIAELYLSNDQAGEALPYLNSGLSVSNERGDIEQSLKASKTLSDVYAEQGDYSKALSNYEKYVALVDQQYEKKQQEIELSKKVLESLYDNRETIKLLEKDRELNASQIALLEQESSQKNLMIYGLLLLIVVILIAGFLLYRSSQQKRLANQLLTLKSLRSQMNPHFIFNALNSVNSFISKNDMRQANKYLSEFSRLMRIVMENSQSDFVPLTEEVSTLELYLKLEHFRFQDKFDYNFQVDEALLSEEYAMPPMLIQPFIENAIWHGLRYKEGKGQLVVKLLSQNNGLKMVIEDNGIGRKRSKALKTENQSQQKSTGMKNTQNRIALINDTYNSKIRLTITDLEGDATGTKVEVFLPKSLMLQPC
ncbi:MAG: histidine kinase [Bacteroidota bacterium]